MTGNILSGTGIPVRLLIGNWWNPWYAPSADGTATPIANPTLFSGAAQYPEQYSPPTVMPVPVNTSTPGPRHLAGINSPPDFPSAYVSNIADDQALIHMGAAPDYPGSSTAAVFRLRQFAYSYGWFSESFTVDGPALYNVLDTGDKCLTNGQFCFAVHSRLAATPSAPFTGPRYLDLHPGGEDQPFIAAFYNAGEATVTLRYGGVSQPEEYVVSESHGGQVFTAYDGTATQITVNLILGAPNAYTVSVYQAGPGWAQSAWLYLHDELVFQNRDYVPLVLKEYPPPTPTPTRTRTPTPTPCPFPPGDPRCTG